ncbi:MAG: endopeptidase La [Chloroflexota bacterium]|nr:endopeptidase La [Chloroflexota bacterium]
MPDDLPILFDFPSGPEAAVIEGQRGECELPVVPLINTVLFPHMLTPLFVGRERSVAAVEEAMEHDRTILVIAQREQDADDVGPGELFGVGVEAHIQRVLKMPDGSTSIVVQGRRRMRVIDFVQERPMLRARAVPIYGEEEKSIAIEAMMRAVLSLFERVVKLSRTLPDDSYIMAMNVDEPGWLADLVASTLPLDVSRRQEILETIDPEERLRRLSIMLTQELDVLELESRIHTQVQKEVDKSQREFFLREQMKAIQRELGQEDPLQRELLELREKILISGMPEKVQLKATEELERMEAMSPASPESSVIRTYLDWLLDLPWTNQTEDTNDLIEAAHTLDRNHYGLPKIKERILEFMAVRQLAGARLKSPILCFVGPPGVGKTSLGRSIAEALGRHFARISLGGIHDEAEIRGHRRTYIGALPGRIIKTMKDTGTINPVFMLDEIDKLGSDFRGDPASALLEVLDPEQNNAFADHYLDVHYDLSKVMFITTANLLDPIPPALRDRLEVIHLPGYTEEEKLQIARQFLVPKQLEANGLTRTEDVGLRTEPGELNLDLSPQSSALDTALQFSEAALRQLIRSYTYEAGVRNLEREIGAICRKVARRVAEGRPFPRVVRPALLTKYLGPAHRSHGVAELRDEIGVATGLSWTANGGDTMAIEVSVMEGKGALTLTGQLGEVMRESAQAALSFARANARRLGIDERRFDKTDIHIHVPEGAVPKDGPSAGITLAIALISALSSQAVKHDVAMTGEITLRGRVLPVGGIKEKILGAHRAGIRTVILPRDNERDIAEVPGHVKRKLAFVYVDHMDDVIASALCAPVSEPVMLKRNGKREKPIKLGA